jgi:hypothetical protein
MLSQIKELDEQSDLVGTEEEGSAFRYYLEQLLNLYRLEECWRQRGRVCWSLQGDANSGTYVPWPTTYIKNATFPACLQIRGLSMTSY